MMRPLVVRFGALGDMVLMTGAIRLLHARFGAPVDILGSGEWTRPLLQGQPGVGEIYLLGSRRRPFWLAPDQWRVLRDLRRRGSGPSWLFDAHNDKTRRLLRRAGWHEGQLIQLDRLPDIGGEHFCDRWRRFASLDPPQRDGPQHSRGRPLQDLQSQNLQSQDASALPRLRVSAQSRAELIPWLQRLGLAGRPFILIQVGNKRTMRRGDRRRPSNTKYWPEQRWATLLVGLRALHPGHALLLLGVAPEAALNDEILDLARVSDAHNLAREMTVPRLMALAQSAFGMVSVDTGPAHVAAALSCPVLVLFDSASKMAMYAPRGPGPPARCLTGPPGGPPSLLGIIPEQVLDAWARMVLRRPAES